MKRRPLRIIAVLGALLSGAVALLGQTEFQPRSMAYVLQGEAFDKNQARAAARLAECGRDLIVIDPEYSPPEARWSPEQITAIRAGRSGRKVVAYLSIGEAEDYRSYWRKAWDANKDGRPDAGAPAFLCNVNPAWRGNYKIKYWHADWQQIMLQEVDRIVAQGFDGLYLDIVDGFEFFEEDHGKFIDDRKNPETGNTYRQDMVQWVLRLAARARAKQKDFLIIPQNGSQLLSHPEFLKSINAIGLEDMFTNGNKAQPANAAKEILINLTPLKSHPLPVLVIEYPRKDNLRQLVKERCKEAGLIPLLTDRQLKSLGEAPLAH